MNRHDNPPEGLTGRQLRLAALKQFHWRAGIRHQIVDPDIDGLLSAALAYRVFGWGQVPWSGVAASFGSWGWWFRR